MISSRLETTARIVLAVLFVPGTVNYWTTMFFGLNWLHASPLWMPWDGLAPELQTLALNWDLQLALVKIITSTSLLLLLFNRAVPLAVAMLAPIAAGLIIFHWLAAAWLTGIGMPVIMGSAIVAVILICELVLLRAHAARFAPLLRA